MNLAESFNPVPKPVHRHRKRSSDFTTKTREAIKSRSGGVCEICRQRKAVHMHHVTYRSQGGSGDASNGLHLCLSCHNAVHETKAMREYAEQIADEIAGR